MGGYRYIHHAIDDYSRVVYSEILYDERKQTAAGFFQRANAFFKDLGVTVPVMTDNAACYRSQAFNQVLSAAGANHRYTTLRGTTLRDDATIGWPSLGWTTTKPGPWKASWKHSPEPRPMREPILRLLLIWGCRFVGWQIAACGAAKVDRW